MVVILYLLMVYLSYFTVGLLTYYYVTFNFTAAIKTGAFIAANIKSSQKVENCQSNKKSTSTHISLKVPSFI